jgi:hypothetical protein
LIAWFYTQDLMIIITRGKIDKNVRVFRLHVYIYGDKAVRPGNSIGVKKCNNWGYLVSV